MINLELYRDKKIAVLGYGVEGKSTYRYLHKHGLNPFILDQMTESDFWQKNPELEESTPVQLGNYYLNELEKFDLIFRSPGIPILTNELQAVRKNTIITSQLEFFFEQCRGVTIGVTGTKGKGTTSTLIHNILKAAGMKVFLGGNIGVPAIDFLDELNPDTFVVIEMSSFQLQTMGRSPHIAVVLNITSDHLDYHRTVEEYRDAKLNIVKHQDSSDFAVINADYEVPKSFALKTEAVIKYFSRKQPVSGCYVDSGYIYLETNEGVAAIADTSELKLRGEHNLENVTAAIEAGYLAGANIKAIKDEVTNFKGLEHRLELVREISRVKYYNDSFSTVPETAIAAIKSFSEPKILILGGSDKGSDYSRLGEVITKSNTKAVILIGAMADKIDKVIGKGFKGQKVKGLTKMSEIVKKSYELAESGDVVILTPACASFGLFQNYKDRGEQFKNAVMEL